MGGPLSCFGDIDTRFMEGKEHLKIFCQALMEVPDQYDQVQKLERKQSKSVRKLAQVDKKKKKKYRGGDIKKGRKVLLRSELIKEKDLTHRESRQDHEGKKEQSFSRCRRDNDSGK